MASGPTPWCRLEPELRHVQIAAADDGCGGAFELDAALEEGGKRSSGSRLEGELGPRHDQAGRFEERVLTHAYDVVDVLLNQWEVARAADGRRQAVGDGTRGRQLLRLAGR